MTKHETLYEKSLSQKKSEEVFDLCCPVTELISEEKLPSLYSLSLTESVCSDSTMDFCNKEPVSHQLASTLDNNINNEEPFKSCESDEQIDHQQNGSMHNKFRKCMSLHDVSQMMHLQMAPKSVNTVSCETIHSQSLSSTTKSKDSGFHRSVSCLSLTSGKRNYDHIESKVKAYIRNIKETEALRKKNKLKQKCEMLQNAELTIDDNESDVVMDKEDLLVKIQELKHELHEKSLYIDAQQKNYNSLLLKFAEAKNTIDALRLQRISLDYSSINESRCASSRMQSFNLDDFFQEINNKSNNVEFLRNSNNDKSNNLKDKCPKQEQILVSSSMSNNSLIESFKPNLHSTPDKSKSCKCLSPVSKLFSSSSRLDRQCEPLVSIQKQSNHPTNFSGTISKPVQLLQSAVKKSKHSSVIGLINKKKFSDVKQKRESTSKLSSHIDLPNVDPFDKVKKWQASLPNINLLGTQSSSDHEDNDGEINSLLSQELVTKCKISEVRIALQHQDSKQSSGEYNDRVKLYSTESNKESKKNFHIDDYSSDSLRQKNNHHLKKSVKSVSSCDFTKVVDPSRNGVYKSRAPIPAIPGNNSVSEDESLSYMPRSSSVSHHTGRTVLKSDTSDDSCTDDSSSISSSVLGPNPSLPSKKSKRKRMKDKSNLLNKIPKLNVEKQICSNFVLREPRLNVTIPDENVVKEWRNSQHSNSNSRNYNLYTFNLKTESSQRKAWNARNNENFYVCQEFNYKHKSSTLQNCITDMEGMVNKSFPIIDNVLERSICK